jgi:hypothetical protein
MPTYRIYFMSEGAHISRPPEVIECSNDQEASEEARRFIDGEDIELWHEGLIVACYPKKGGPF